MDKISDETAQKLAAAIDRLAAAIERTTGIASLSGGIQVYHYGAPSYPSPQTIPGPSWGGAGRQ